MRAKVRPHRRRQPPVTPAPGEIPMAEWLLEGELSRGFPYWVIAIPGLLVLAGRALEATVGGSGIVGRAVRRLQRR